MPHARVIIFAGGDLGDPQGYRSFFREDDFIICANGGTLHAHACGVQPHLIVGDGDSLPPGEAERLQEGAVPWRRHPAAKDQSDLELALNEALSREAREIVILGAFGGEREDHFLANLLLLKLPLSRGVPARMLAGGREAQLFDREAVFKGCPGDTLSLFALGGPAEGIDTEGLLYPLAGETLFFASTRGLSNEFVAPRARITLRRGLLLALKTARKSP